jgi:hypothetical protein
MRLDQFIVIVVPALAIVCGLFGCHERDRPDDIDQCLRRELFNECMAALPEGPQRTVANDWDEVVEACDSRAFHSAWRNKRDIPRGCR